MQLTSSWASKTIICMKSFAFFEKGKTYYCTHDNGDHFYVWCPQERFGVGQIKLSKEHKVKFTFER